MDLLVPLKVSSRTISSPNCHPATESETSPVAEGSSKSDEYIELRFDLTLRSSRSFVIGSGPQCDIRLPLQEGIGELHCSIELDLRRRLAVRDLDSGHGTEVVYTPQAHLPSAALTGHGEIPKSRHDFVWIIGGDPFLRNCSKIEIVMSDAVRIKFQVPSFPNDIDHVNKIRQLDGFSEYSIRSKTPPSHLGTLSDTSIMLEVCIGMGRCSWVYWAWDVSTGGDRAIKRAKNHVTASEWAHEIQIIRRLRHAHIIEFLGHDPGSPREYSMEYAPEGSLDLHGKLPLGAAAQVLQQCLSALEYLHGHDPPIIHRDVKPSNILVHCRVSDKIVVKLADLGYATDTMQPFSFCGVSIYRSPEVMRQQNGSCLDPSDLIGFHPAMDIWALGVVVYEATCDIGEITEQWDIADQVREKADNAGLYHFLSRHMVIRDWRRRSCAAQCARIAQGLTQGEETTTGETPS